MAEPGAVGVVILAAGSSRRLGRPKQLLTLDGKPLLQHVVDAAHAAGVGEVIVVLGHAADDVAGSIDLPAGARVVVNPDHASGQASSLHAGLGALGESVARAVVLLGDQPRVRVDAIRDVAHGPGPIRRAVYRGTPGHPVAFDRKLWDELAAVRGDVGGRDLIAAHPEGVRSVAIDAEPPMDVDTESDARAVGVEH